MALSPQQKGQLASVITKYRGWIAFVLGFVSGLLIGYLTGTWQLLVLSAVLAGFFATTYKRGLLYGSMSILAVYIYFVLIYVFTTPALTVLNVFIGIIGLSGMGIIALLITLLIGFLVGLTGGYLGAVIHSFITWPTWEPVKE